MSMADHDIAELATLCDAVIDGALAGEQQTRLNQILNQSEAARQFYVRYLGMSASLLEYGEQNFQSPHVQPNRVKHDRSRLGWKLAALATAAVVLAIIWHGLNGHNSEADAEEFAAQITGLEDCTWANANAIPSVGDELRHGQHLELKNGVAEITFDSGAQITLEGPATLELNSAWEATLLGGKLRADVPTEAVGFAVHSDSVDVVDLGTQFGMAVDAGGATDLCVLAGTVEATPRDARGIESTKIVLPELTARRFRRSGNEEIKNVANLIGQFKKPTKLERRGKNVKYVRWSFDETDGRVAKAEGSWLGAGELGASIETSNDNVQNEPRIDGKWRGALRFDGKLSVQANVPEFADRAPRTIAFWVRIPTDAPLGDAGPMVAWLAQAQDPAHSQLVRIGWNTNPAQGPVGSLRTEIGRITAIGASNLRDGQWHHVAVVIVPQNTGKKRWHIKQYVDGHFEAAIDKVAKKLPDEVVGQPADSVVWLGCQGNKAKPGGPKFHGDLDELFLVDRALPPQFIGQLMKKNSPAGLATATVE